MKLANHRFQSQLTTLWSLFGFAIGGVAVGLITGCAQNAHDIQLYSKAEAPLPPLPKLHSAELVMTSKAPVRPAVADLDRDGFPELLIGHAFLGYEPGEPSSQLSGFGKSISVQPDSTPRITTSDKHNLAIFSGVAAAERWRLDSVKWLGDHTEHWEIPGG